MPGSNDDSQDRHLEHEVRSRLDGDDSLHIRSMARYQVAIADGRATLAGHVRSRQVARSMATLANGVRGVSSVVDQLVADEELVPLVAAAIGRSPLNRGSQLVVRAELGHMRIGGTYASPEARAEALRVGAEFPGVVDVSGSRPSDLIV